MKFTRFLALVVAAAGITIPTESVVASADTAQNLCTAGQIHVSLGRFQGTAEATVVPLIFTNTGSTCTIYGVPAVQPVADAVRLRPVGPPAHNDSMAMYPALHQLRKGQSVSALLRFTETGNYSVGTCKPAAIGGLVVSLLNVSHHYVRFPQTVCTALPSVATRLIGSGTQG